MKQYFPFFSNNPELTYLDSASTSQKPEIVIEAVDKYFREQCANAGRGSYALANRITGEVESIRGKVARFIGAMHADEIIFTSGTTASINSVAQGWAFHNLCDGDTILYCPQDHAANVLPWMHVRDLLKDRGITIELIPFSVTDVGDADIDDILRKISGNTRIISLTHIHNVYGSKSEIERLKGNIPDRVRISVDAAQSAGHIPLNVQELGADFLSFSGHKMFAAPGIGCLWINPRVREEFHAITSGGGEHPLEPGTLNISGIISLGAAIDFINEMAIEKIHEHSFALTHQVINGLRELPNVELLPGVAFASCNVGYGIVSFRLPGQRSEDVGFYLDSRNIAVRTGSHCNANPEIFNDAIRVSFYAYNTQEDIDKLLNSLHDIG